MEKERKKKIKKKKKQKKKYIAVSVHKLRGKKGR